MLLSSVPGAFSAEATVKGTERRHLRGTQYDWCYTTPRDMCRAVEACTWNNNGCQPSRGAINRAKGLAPKFGGGGPKHGGPKLGPPPPAGGPGGPRVPASVCRTTSSPVACAFMNGCSWNGNGCRAFAYDYKEFDSGDFELEASPDDVDSADYDEEYDEEYYEDEDEDEEDADMMVA